MLTNYHYNPKFSLGSDSILELAQSLIPNFIGVYSKDKLPSKYQEGNYIVNMQGYNQGDGKGTHWVCFYTSPHQGFYFDSLGGPPPLEITEFVGNMPLKSNHYQIQNEDSNLCGEYCIYFLTNLHKVGANEALKGFKAGKTKENDNILFNWWKKYKLYPVGRV